MTRNTPAVVADDGLNPLAWIDPTRADFFKECAGVARDLVERHGNDKWAASAQGLLTAAIMQQVLYAARENRTPSLIDVARGLSSAFHTVRRRTRLHSYQEKDL